MTVTTEFARTVRFTAVQYTKTGERLA